MRDKKAGTTNKPLNAALFWYDIDVSLKMLMVLSITTLTLYKRSQCSVFRGIPGYNRKSLSGYV